MSLHLDAVINGQRIVADATATDPRDGWLDLDVQAVVGARLSFADEIVGHRVHFVCVADLDDDRVCGLLELCADGEYRPARIDEGALLEETAMALAREWRPGKR